MSKKINTKSLIEKIEKVTREKLSEQNVVSLSDYRNLTQREEPKTVLVVEDDETVRVSIKKVLEKDGYRVLVAADGTQLSLVLDDTPIELIILDIGLPWINGIELAKLMKEHKDLRDIPLIFVSGQVSDLDVKRGFQAGANDYIKKPFEVEELRKAVSALMTLNSKK